MRYNIVSTLQAKIATLSTIGVLSLVLSLSMVLTGFAGLMTQDAHAAARYACGRQCNGHSPSWVIPGNGIQCSRSGALVAQAYPRDTYTGAPDNYLTVQMYYSNVCQTMWAKVTNTRAIGRWYCQYALQHNASDYYWTGPSASCPAAGTAVTTYMIDDHSPSYNIGGNFTLNDDAGNYQYSYFFQY